MNQKIKKIIPYFFITLLALVGFLGAGTQVNAQAVPTNQNYLDCVKNNWGTQVQCATTNPDKIAPLNTGIPTNQNYLDCVAKNYGTPAQCATTNPDTAASLAVAPKTAFESYVGSHGCGLTGNNSLLPGCLISGSYYLFYVIPAFILWLGAYFFNVLISITLSSKLFAGSTFIPTAWAVVRDLSNIFFILVLLYIAIRMILDIGGSDAKKMIVRVIIMALLINFSMFFTEVIIDSSNMLALIFYNKTSVSTKDANGQERPYDSVTGEKDVAGGMVNAFDPTRLLTADFFKTAGTVNTGVIGAAPIQGEVSFGMLIGITILAGVIMLFAAYCLFIAGISFLGRMIEFFVLIVFSPFAFMSSTIPLLEKVEYIGWDAWFKRLLTVSFMAPIFMFFIYFIFLLISIKPPLFDSLVTQTGQGTMVRILSIVIPAMIILILLMKATSFAKKASGTLGEVLIKGTEIAMGAAVGLTAGIAANRLQATVGEKGRQLGESKWVKEHGAIGRGIGNVGKYLGKSEFDIRKGVVGAGLATVGGISGLDLGHKTKYFMKSGGAEADRKNYIEKEKRRKRELEVGEDEPSKQKLNNSEIDLQKMLAKVTRDFERIDADLVAERQAATDAVRGSPEELRAKANIKDLNEQKKALRTGAVYNGSIESVDANGAIVQTATNADGRAYTVASGDNFGSTIKDLQAKIIPAQKNEIVTINRTRGLDYAKSLQNKGIRIPIPWTNYEYEMHGPLGAGNNRASRAEAIHKLIMEDKIEPTK